MGQAKKKAATLEERIKLAQERDALQKQIDEAAREERRKLSYEEDKICYANTEKVKMWILETHPRHPVHTPVKMHDSLVNRVDTKRYRIMDRKDRCRTFDLDDSDPENVVLHETVRRDDTSNIAMLAMASAVMAGGAWTNPSIFRPPAADRGPVTKGKNKSRKK